MTMGGNSTREICRQTGQDTMLETWGSNPTTVPQRQVKFILAFSCKSCLFG